MLGQGRAVVAAGGPDAGGRAAVEAGLVGLAGAGQERRGGGP